MSKESSYQTQLRELYASYTGKELEGYLGVTTRSIQNYIKDKSPTIPGPAVIRKIREAYAKHLEGGLHEKPLQKEGMPPPDIMLVEALQNYIKLNSKIDEINSYLKQVTLDQVGLTSRVLEGQEELKRLISGISGSKASSQGGKSLRTGNPHSKGGK